MAELTRREAWMFTFSPIEEAFRPLREAITILERPSISVPALGNLTIEELQMLFSIIRRNMDPRMFIQLILVVLIALVIWACGGFGLSKPSRTLRDALEEAGYRDLLIECHATYGPGIVAGGGERLGGFTVTVGGKPVGLIGEGNRQNLLLLPVPRGQTAALQRVSNTPVANGTC